MPKSYISLYWKVWLTLVVFLLVIRLTVFFGTQDEKVLFAMFMWYIAPTWITVMVLNLYEGRRLMHYLERNHREKWKELTYIPGFGPGGHNSFRTLPFIYSKDDLGDPVLKDLKMNYRRFIKFVLTVFFTVPVLLFALATPLRN
jgi:hypothetical protein